MKKNVIFVFCIILLISPIMAQEYNLDISTSKDIFKAGEDIVLKVTLRDSSNDLIQDNISVKLEDAERKINLKKTIPANEFVNLEIGDHASHGQGTITAQYKDSSTTGIFTIEIKELARFDLDKDILTITNIGNTKYSKSVQINIGETTGIKQPKLFAGESVSYRLIAPEGTYNIKITDGKTTLEKENMQLSSGGLTGKSIGIINERDSDQTTITGGISPDEEKEDAILNYMKNSKSIYIFVMAIFGIMILLAIERKYSKKKSKK